MVRFRVWDVPQPTHLRRFKGLHCRLGRPINGWLARQGAAGCEGVSVRMDRLDASAIDRLENRLLNPERLAAMMDNIIDRRSARIMA
jgi:hypothetical protein